jgi:hypothetical protein
MALAIYDTPAMGGREEQEWLRQWLKRRSLQKAFPGSDITFVNPADYKDEAMTQSIPGRFGVTSTGERMMTQGGLSGQGGLQRGELGVPGSAQRMGTTTQGAGSLSIGGGYSGANTSPFIQGVGGQEVIGVDRLPYGASDYRTSSTTQQRRGGVPYQQGLGRNLQRQGLADYADYSVAGVDDSRLGNLDPSQGRIALPGTQPSEHYGSLAGFDPDPFGIRAGDPGWKTGAKIGLTAMGPSFIQAYGIAKRAKAYSRAGGPDKYLSSVGGQPYGWGGQGLAMPKGETYADHLRELGFTREAQDHLDKYVDWTAPSGIGHALQGGLGIEEQEEEMFGDARRRNVW